MKKTISAAFFWLAAATTATAGGFQVPLQGQKQTGMAHAGTALALGPTAVFFNPGAMGFSPGGVYLGVQPVYAAGAYRSGDYLERNEPLWNFPFNAYAHVPLSDSSRWSVGVGIYTPFGLSIRWPGNWKGRFIVRYAGLLTAFVQPTIAFRINDKMGVGLGPAPAVALFNLERALPIGDETGSEATAKLAGSAVSVGVNVGFYYRPVKYVSLGLSWRSPTAFRLRDGAATFSVPSSVEAQFPQTRFQSSLTLPMVASLGAAVYPVEKLVVSLEVNFTGWRAFKELKFDFRDNTAALSDQTSPRNYRDAWTFRLGAQYKIHERLTVRAGGLYDFTPVPDDYLSPELPDGDLRCVTAGASVSIIPQLDVDLSFVFASAKRRTTTLKEANFSGTYQAFLYIPGIGFEYRF
ncbi:MAG: outer membrane protein transport protein [Bacteroidia bacterium]|nr:outer membrane protein transport protein [Bacteroidia bacterium]MDW8334136.1 outer membrane protein transport protein [Bacteroidia bacterium]